jgi:beta-galactosidase
MLSIANNWTETSPLNVTIYSNCEEVALYLNDVLVNKQRPSINANSDQLRHPPFLFNLDKFVAGTLRADGFINGNKVVTNIVKTPKSPIKIELAYDISSIPINPDSPDMIFVYAKITDANGTTIPTATNEVNFSLLEGNAELIGENPIKAEAGIATIILKTKNLKKPIKVVAKSENLQLQNRSDLVFNPVSQK